MEITFGNISINLNKNELVDRLFPDISEQLRNSVSIWAKDGGTIEFKFQPDENTSERDWKLLSRTIERLKLPPEHPLNKKVSDCNLTARAQNVLRHCEIKTLGDLVVYNRWELSKTQNVGPLTMNEFEDLLTKHGLDFRTT